MAKKKLSKVVEGTVLSITIGDRKMSFDSDELSDEIKQHLTMHGLSQKLGDSTASCDDEAECVEAIEATWSNLKDGKWSSRQPAGEKITKKGLLEKFNMLSSDEQEALLPLMQKLGIIK